MSASAPTSSRWKSLRQKLGLSLATFVICLGGLEIILRLNGYGNLEIYQPDSNLYWRLKPNQDCYTKVNHKPVHINSQGTRGPEFAAKKLAGVTRILSLGDSRTFGWGVAEADTYSERLQQLLRQQAWDQRKIEIINAGVNAWSYAQMLVYFRNTALGYSPDFVILGEANEWTQFSEKNSAEFVKKFIWRVRLKNWLRRSAIYHYVIEVRLQNFYGRHRTKFIPVDAKQDTFFKEQQQKDPETVFPPAIQDICALDLSNHIQPLLLYLPTVRDLGATNPPTILKIKREISQKLGIPLVDLTTNLAPEGEALYLDADPVHLNERGNEIVGQRLFETVRQFAVK